MAKSIHLKLDFRGGQPVYQQIASQVQAMVEAGELKPGDQLPTVRQVAEDLRINFNTVARAYRILDEAGIISTQHGRGTYIWEKSPVEASNQVRSEALASLTRAFFEEAARLGFPLAEARAALAAELARWKDGLPRPAA